MDFQGVDWTPPTDGAAPQSVQTSSAQIDTGTPDTGNTPAKPEPKDLPGEIDLGGKASQDSFAAALTGALFAVAAVVAVMLGAPIWLAAILGATAIVSGVVALIQSVFVSVFGEDSILARPFRSAGNAASLFAAGLGKFLTGDFAGAFKDWSYPKLGDWVWFIAMVVGVAYCLKKYKLFGRRRR